MRVCLQCVRVRACVSVCLCIHLHCYGVATVSRIDKIIGLFCRILSLLQGSFAKKTCDLIDHTNQSHPIWASVFLNVHNHICTALVI